MHTFPSLDGTWDKDPYTPHVIDLQREMQFLHQTEVIASLDYEHYFNLLFAMILSIYFMFPFKFILFWSIFMCFSC